MDKENNITIITSALNEKRIFKKPYYCFKSKRQNKEIEKKIKKDKPTEILVYDITKSKKDKQNKIFSVNDHVNKTGENPLIKKNKTPRFLDISKTYKKQKKGIITTCFGKNFNQKTHTAQYPSTNLCLVTIWCKNLNPKIQIKAFLINSL